jgi:hypothetical protein
MLYSSSILLDVAHIKSVARLFLLHFALMVDAKRVAPFV